MPLDLSPALVDAIRSIQLVVFDFDGVFTDNFVYVDQNGVESVRCWRGDGLGLRALDRLGIHTAIVSTETNPVVAARARKLKIACLQGIERKLEEVEQLRVRHQLDWRHVAFVGNDTNDAECLQAVGLPIVVADAHEDVRPLATYITRALGGRGAVREVCDLVARTRASRASLD
ncbi:MAG TPA: HAD hydrolase family protein [Kofleriaceae bacterium]|jgi:YrbI family 3-deoxy-D-manno-octulosonate 8-phosphate phosphatase